MLAVAESQYGVLTVAQAASVGVAEHKVRYQTHVGRLEVVRPGVLRVAGAPLTPRQRAKAVTLWLGPDSAISHETGARLLRLDMAATTRDVHVSVLGDTSKARRAADVVAHRTRLLPDRHRIFVDGIPATAAARTVIDLAGQCDGEELDALAESARRLGLMSIAELERTMADCGQRRGRASVARYLDYLGSHPALESRLEVRTAGLLRRSGLEPWVGQHRIRAADGRVFRVDFAWPARQLAVECDGYRWHGRYAVWKRDRRRIAAIERLGWRVLIVTWDDVTRHRAETVDRIRLALCTG
ncbi:MAG TPA: type IV toxin-antitoxin system AbiEi family antitoxin domain-containing protein [Acidimicrobiia bacterium]|jgi:hypothetical protein